MLERRSHKIDIVRGLSFIFVFFYHSDLGMTPAGFLGVDAFFVVSGFLICRKLITNSKFEFKDLISFMASRIQRLAVPLSYVVFFTALCSVWLFDQVTVYTTSKMAFSSIFFFSNAIAFSEGGYFGNSGDNLLLHTWSLSVEIQFYLCLALTFWLIGCLKKSDHLKTLMIVSWLMLAISLTCVFVVNSIQTNLSFYAPFTRYWEFLFGAIVCLISVKINCKRLSTNKGQALQYVFLFALIIVFLHQNPQNHVGLSNLVVSLVVSAILLTPSELSTSWLKPISSIGRCSYSLYLVHFPIYLFISTGFPQNNLYIKLLVSIALTAFLGTFLFKFIEKGRVANA